MYNIQLRVNGSDGVVVVIGGGDAYLSRHASLGATSKQDLCLAVEPPCSHILAWLGSDAAPWGVMCHPFSGVNFETPLEEGSQGFGFNIWRRCK